MYSHWYKIAKIVLFNQIDTNVEATFKSLLPGDWTLTGHRRIRPPYYLQMYGSINLLGDYSVKEFDVKIFYEVRKAEGTIEHPYDGYHDDEGKFFPDKEFADFADDDRVEEDEKVKNEISRRFKQIDQLQKKSLIGFDSQLGTPLLSFRGFVSAKLKNENPENIDFRENRENFEGLDTPKEIADFVYDYMQRSFGGGNGPNEPNFNPPKLSPTIIPNRPVLV